MKKGFLALALAGALALPFPALAQQSAAPLEACAAQERMVAELSGWSSSEGQRVPFSRSTRGERSVAAAYLLDALAEVGLLGEVHEYQLPNINGLVDLLLPSYRGKNVLVDVPASGGAEEVVVVGAHYDSEPRSPGGRSTIHRGSQWYGPWHNGSPGRHSSA